MNTELRAQILDDELLIVRDSGEIPEIALHATLHYLQEDPDGPQLTLTDAELQSLQDAALARCREIVLRDLDPDNRDLSIYRGIKRSIYNWQRLQAFCDRIGRRESGFKGVVREALVSFVYRELADVAAGIRSPAINCSVEELAVFCRQLGMDAGILPPGWQRLCPEQEKSEHAHRNNRNR